MEDADLARVEAELAEASGWTKLTGQKRIPIRNAVAMYAGSEDSPLHRKVMQAFRRGAARPSARYVLSSR